MIELTDIHKSYQLGTVSVTVLKGLDLTIEAGESMEPAIQVPSRSVCSGRNAMSSKPNVGRDPPMGF